jgi:hypothetical protein
MLKVATQVPGSRFRLAALAVSLAILTLALALGKPKTASAAPPAPAAPAAFDPKNGNWEGLSQFLELAENEAGPGRVVPTTALDLGRLLPEDAVLAIHPTLPMEADELSAFMRAGGRVAILDDYGSGDALLVAFGISRVPLPGHPTEMLRANPALAIAEPAGQHPLVRSVTRVVTNHATGLSHPGLSPVLVVRGRDEPDVLLALAGSVGRGRLLAVGDASVVINEMLRFPGNRAFATGLVRYLTEDDASVRRAGKLYLLTGAFETTGTFGAVSPAASVAVALRRALASGVEELEQHGAPPPVVYLMAAAVAIGVLGWAAARGARTHKPVEPRFSRAVPVAAQGGVAGHAAVLGAPGTPRALAMLELKSALEEDLATRLGLERAPSRDQIVARIRTEHLLDDEDADALAALLAKFARIEDPRIKDPSARGERTARSGLRDAEVNAAAGEVSRLLAAVDAARRGTVEKPP